MLVDTHCHLDAAEFDADRSAVIERAGRAGVRGVVIPAVCAGNFDAVRDLAHALRGGAYALGIHPLFVPQATGNDLAVLEARIEGAMDDARFVAIGEIGLDFFVPELKTPAMRERQEHFYQVQLALARRFGLPVLLHVRRSQDRLLKYLRAGPPVGGIAHAFNGSRQQADAFLAQGFALGFGGTLTFERSLQIRRLATDLPETSFVLETDAPDIAPAWLGERGGPPARNEPAELAGIARVMADVRSVDVVTVARLSNENACRVLPRLAGALAGA